MAKVCSTHQQLLLHTNSLKLHAVHKKMHALSLEIGNRTNLTPGKRMFYSKQEKWLFYYERLFYVGKFVLQLGTEFVLLGLVCSTKLVEQSFCWMQIVLLNKTINLNCRTYCLGILCSSNSNHRSNLTRVRECSIRERIQRHQ